MEKKENMLVGLVIILSILVVALSSYIIYDKVLSKENENNVINNNEGKQDDNITESNITWYDYLISQEFVSASLKVCSIDGKNVIEKDNEWQPNPGASRSITETELKNILNTLYKSESKNSGYSEVVKGGYAEPACIDKIIYKYMHEGEEYEFILNYGSIIVTEDEEFIKILDNNMNSYQYYALNKKNNRYIDLIEDMMRDYVNYANY